VKESLTKGYWQTSQAESETDAPQIWHAEVLRPRAVEVSYSEPIPTWLFLAELQYVDGFGEFSGAPGAVAELAQDPPVLKLGVCPFSGVVGPAAGDPADGDEGGAVEDAVGLPRSGLGRNGSCAVIESMGRALGWTLSKPAGDLARAGGGAHVLEAISQVIGMQLPVRGPGVKPQPSRALTCGSVG
jgi:hypothetical protein